MNHDLDTRSGWPEELRVLLERHPRTLWKEHGTATTQFWLAQHDSFRRHCAALRDAADELRASRMAPHELCAQIVPRLQGFIGHLYGHHQVEDYHYFPVFRAHEQRLVHGFDVLARDHEVIHAGLERLVAAVNDLIAVVRGVTADGAAAVGPMLAAERYVQTSETLIKQLVRHLEDEEDLVIPVMLARGD